MDLLLTEANSAIKLNKIDPGPFISDHRFGDVNFYLDRTEENGNETRDYKHMDINAFVSYLMLDEIVSTDLTLVEFLNKIRYTIHKNLDKHVPKRFVPTGRRINKSWFNSELREQRKIVRNRQYIYNKYKEDHHWTAYKIQTNRYSAMLRSAMSKFISEQVLKSSNCSKDLYKIVNNLTSSVPDNTMPHCDDDTELANKFADIFIN